jgi:uncharacterized protein YcbK (DUF882 family)
MSMRKRTVPPPWPGVLGGWVCLAALAACAPLPKGTATGSAPASAAPAPTAATAASASDAPTETRTAASFNAWRPANAARVQAFEDFLRQQQLLQVAPLHELLRSASDWQRCQAEPYDVPPQPQWPAVASTLRLLQALRAAGAVGELEIHSAYRHEALNVCAGGSARSTHWLSFAIDFTPAGDAAGLAMAGHRICKFWLDQGRAWEMGFGLYRSGRIHIDTWRYRTWGHDHSSATAACTG